MSSTRSTQSQASFLAAFFSFCLVAVPGSSREPAPEINEVDVAQAEKLIAETPGIVILDIRTPTEFAGGHIRGAVNIDYNSREFDEKLEALDRTKPYLVHCHSGARSGRSLRTFRKLDFRNVYHLSAGSSGWIEAGKPVVK